MRVSLKWVSVCLLSVAACLLCTTAARAIDCDTMPARPPIEFDSLRVFQFNGGANCWGYTAPDGTPYALMGATDGIGVVNVKTMLLVGFVPMQVCTWRELKTYRHYCYAVSECSGDPNPGMMIIDLQYLPDSAHLVGTWTIPGQNRSHCISIDTAKGFCYLVRDYSGFHIISLANPEAPLYVNSVTTPDIHDMTAFGDTVYVAEANARSFSIWNVTNKAAPVMLARVTIPGGGYVHNIWPTPDRRFLVTTEETPFKTVKFWNRENLNSIQLVAEYLGPSNLAHNAHIEGHYLYLSHYESGLSVLDISTPECPVEVKRFDTYELGDSPQLEGCWGVYPHTAGSGYVYASNLDGRLYIFHTDIVVSDFQASPRVGAAPLTVNFTDASPTSQTWKWRFGDGDSATVENPTHVYGAGLYNVELRITSPQGAGTEYKPNYVTALAETLKVADTALGQSVTAYWEIRTRNNVPIAEIKLPVRLGNVPALATFDSISTVGCRTNYFELQQPVFDNRPIGQEAIRLKADNGGGSPPLPPGDGPIARVYLTIQPNAAPNGQISLSLPPMGSHSLLATTLTTTYVPALKSGTITILSATCICDCHADPICDGLSDILDVSKTIDVAFRGVNPTIDVNCPHAGRTDVNCSGVTDIIDVIDMIAVAFRGADAAATFCDPCAP